MAICCVVVSSEVLKSHHVGDELSGTADVPSGQAFILLQSSGENSIIIVAGANHSWPKQLPASLEKALASAAAVMLQREITQDVNLAVAKIAQSVAHWQTMSSSGSRRGEWMSLVSGC